jgi:hypothetical protein
MRGKPRWLVDDDNVVIVVDDLHRIDNHRFDARWLFWLKAHIEVIPCSHPIALDSWLAAQRSPAGVNDLLSKGSGESKQPGKHNIEALSTKPFWDLD